MSDILKSVIPVVFFRRFSFFLDFEQSPFSSKFRGVDGKQVSMPAWLTRAKTFPTPVLLAARGIAAQKAR